MLGTWKAGGSLGAKDGTDGVTSSASNGERKNESMSTRYGALWSNGWLWMPGYKDFSPDDKKTKKRSRRRSGSIGSQESYIV